MDYRCVIFYVFTTLITFHGFSQESALKPNQNVYKNLFLEEYKRFEKRIMELEQKRQDQMELDQGLMEFELCRFMYFMRIEDIDKKNQTEPSEEEWKRRWEGAREIDETWNQIVEEGKNFDELQRQCQEGKKEDQEKIQKKLEELRKKFEKLYDRLGEILDRFNEDQVQEELNPSDRRLGEDLQQEEKAKVEEVKELISKEFGLNPQIARGEQNSKKQCLNSLNSDLFISQDWKLLLFISFSVPETAWMSLSQELEKYGGTFVLRGLPNQSFQELASRILKLKEKGVNASIQLDPKSFLAYEINQVPAIVIAEDRIFDKLSGHVSLKFALEKMAQYGETHSAKILYQSMKDRA
jgi:conjugal transfer pilus assembly protein TrbC